MNIELIRDFLLWCTVINYLMLFIWFFVFIYAYEWMRQLHGRWFRMSDERFDMIHYAGMAIYKIGILLLNLIPFIALTLVARHGG